MSREATQQNLRKRSRVDLSSCGSPQTVIAQPASPYQSGACKTNCTKTVVGESRKQSDILYIFLFCAYGSPANIRRKLVSFQQLTQDGSPTACSVRFVYLHQAGIGTPLRGSAGNRFWLQQAPESFLHRRPPQDARGRKVAGFSRGLAMGTLTDSRQWNIAHNLH